MQEGNIYLKYVEQQLYIQFNLRKANPELDTGRPWLTPRPAE